MTIQFKKIYYNTY